VLCDAGGGDLKEERFVSDSGQEFKIAKPLIYKGLFTRNMLRHEAGICK